MSKRKQALRSLSANECGAVSALPTEPIRAHYCSTIFLHKKRLLFNIICMNISTQDIFEFYEMRIACHVKSVNYFAGLLGYHFPEHDSDKVQEPIRTGYAYIFYNSYHPKLHLMDEYFALCKDAHDMHHKHSVHHIESYKDVKDIPDIRLCEMIADWASANFEQINIIHEPGSVPIEE